MENFIYEYKTKVFIGDGMLQQHLSNELKPYHTILLAYGGGSIIKNGFYQEIKDILKDKKVIDFSGIMSNPTYAKVQEGAKLVKDKHVDFILAVGGGSVIDACKIIGAQAKLNQDIWTLEFIHHQYPMQTVPMGAIVTATGTGAEMNGGAVITHEELKIKAGVLGFPPVFAFLEPRMTMTVPRSQVISGAFDTLSHAMETYLGISSQNHVSDDLALAICRNTVVHLETICKNENDIEARKNLMWDSAMAENGILKIGRKTDFQVHQIEHQLGAYTDCNHGQGLAVIQPVYYRHILKDAIDKFYRFALAVFPNEVKGETKEEIAESGLECLEGIIKRSGLPTKLSQLDSTVEITEALLKEVAYSCHLIQTNPRILDHQEIFDILKECM